METVARVCISTDTQSYEINCQLLGEAYELTPSFNRRLQTLESFYIILPKIQCMDNSVVEHFYVASYIHNGNCCCQLLLASVHSHDLSSAEGSAYGNIKLL
jgi:hypothetical protein